MTALLFTAACGDAFDIPNTNAPTVEELTGNPTKSTLARAALGVAAAFRNDVAGEIATWGPFGREGYNLNGNDPRLTGETIRGPLEPGGVGGGSWAGKYQALRSTNNYIVAIDQAPDLTAAEKSASKGFAKTLKAIMLHRLIVRNGALGIPVDVEAGLNDPPAPFLSQANAYARIVTLLNEAASDLQAGGTAFPFTMPPGYVGFTTPSTYLQFNRGYAAKVHAHRATFLNGGTAAYQDALTALGASFLTTTGLPGTLANGVYYEFSSASGETSNPIAEPLTALRYFVHPSLETGAQRKANNDLDDRFTSKTRPVTPRTVNDLTSGFKPALYNTNTPTGSTANLDADIAVLKNEELILLRAEARWYTGDKAGALADINLVRINSGGLPATTLTTASADAAFRTELLYNRLYSLMWEQGTRWIDARRFGVTNTLPIDRPGDTIFPNMLVPASECDARGLTVPCTPAVQ